MVQKKPMTAQGEQEHCQVRAQASGVCRAMDMEVSEWERGPHLLCGCSLPGGKPAAG